MPAASLITLTDVHLTLELVGGTPPGVDYQCQVTTASLDPTPNLQAVDATLCAPATQQPVASSFVLTLVWYQDWGKTDSLSQFLLDHDTELATFEIDGLAVTDAGAIRQVASGTVALVTGAYGGAAGAPLTATAACPVQGKPVVGPGVTTATAAAASSSDTGEG